MRERASVCVEVVSGGGCFFCFVPFCVIKMRVTSFGRGQGTFNRVSSFDRKSCILLNTHICVLWLIAHLPQFPRTIFDCDADFLFLQIIYFHLCGAVFACAPPFVHFVFAIRSRRRITEESA